MRHRALCIVLLLGACHPAAAPFVAVGAVEASSVAVFGRGSVDLVYSTISGRDCSIVRLERGDSYCKPPERRPPPEPFCTRTLGMPECFATPADLPDHPAELGDAPPPAAPVKRAKP
jgi:hypothetical protein